MIESLSYHTNTVADFIVCYNEEHLTTDNIFVTPRKKIMNIYTFPDNQIVCGILNGSQKMMVMMMVVVVMVVVMVVVVIVVVMRIMMVVI